MPVIDLLTGRATPSLHDTRHHTPTWELYWAGHQESRLMDMRKNFQEIDDAYAMDVGLLGNQLMQAQAERAAAEAREESRYLQGFFEPRLKVEPMDPIAGVPPVLRAPDATASSKGLLRSITEAYPQAYEGLTEKKKLKKAYDDVVAESQLMPARYRSPDDTGFYQLVFPPQAPRFPPGPQIFISASRLSSPE